VQEIKKQAGDVSQVKIYINVSIPCDYHKFFYGRNVPIRIDAKNQIFKLKENRGKVGILPVMMTA